MWAAGLTASIRPTPETRTYLDWEGESADAGDADVAGRCGEVLSRRKPKAKAELQALGGLTHQQHFVKAYLKPLLAAGWLGRIESQMAII